MTSRSGGWVARPRWERWRIPGLVIGLLVAVLLGAGCEVHTQVDVEATAKGSGQVVVTVTLDRSANAAVGGVVGQLRTSDLVAAGWQVGAPASLGDGETVVRAAHDFTTSSQVPAIMAEIAGRGPIAGRPFRLRVYRYRDWWRTHTVVSGAVDLRCDVGCFGDPGLAARLGYPTGVSPGSLASQRQEFHFGVTVTVPGTVGRTTASQRSGHRLSWSPKIGELTVLSVTTSSVDTGHVVGTLAVVGTAAVILLLATLGGVRRRRRRRLGRHSRSVGWLR